MLLKNRRSGQTIEISFYTDQQAVDIAVSCLISAYGEENNYVKPEMFDKNYLLDGIKRDKMRVFAAVAADGTPAVAVTLFRQPYFENAWEMGAAAVSNSYKGFHLASAIVRHILNKFENASQPLFYAHATLFYTRAGMALEDNGFVPTGFLYAVCDAGKHMSQLNFTSLKHTLALYIRNNGTTDVGKLYVPEHLAEFIMELYGALGISPVLVRSGSSRDASGPDATKRDISIPGNPSQLSYEQDEYHLTLYIYIMTCGVDLKSRLKAIECQYTQKLQSMVLHLNINDPGAVYGYEMLKDSGYKFSGIKPLCGDHEYLLMSKFGSSLISTAELQMTDLDRRVYERVDRIE